MEGGGFESGLGMGHAPMVPTLPPPRPKSPPPYPDLYGKRRDIARIQMLEREKTFLEEELKLVKGLQPASRCCKEIVDFVTANGDPFIAKNRKISKCGRLWKWLCGPCLSCFSCSWICCFTGCSIHLKPGQCCCSSCQCCKFRDCCSCLNFCSLPKCPCFCNPFSSPCYSSTTTNCCSCPKISCWKCFKPLESSIFCSNCCSVSCKCKCSCPKCSFPKFSPCGKCSSGCGRGCFSCVKDCCNCCCYRPCRCICC